MSIEIPFAGRFHYSRAELIADGVVHAVGIVLAISAGSILLAFSAFHAGVWEYVAAVLYVVALLTVPPWGPLRHPETGAVIGNTPFMDAGWIQNHIVCSGSDGTAAYNYLIVHESDPRYTGNPDWAVWGNWEYHVLTESGSGNLAKVGPQNHIP